MIPSVGRIVHYQLTESDAASIAAARRDSGGARVGNPVTVGAVSLQLVWGLISALLLNRAFRGLNFVRSLFVLPYLLPSIVVALIFQWLLSQEYGVVNQALMQTGVIARPINFFGGLGTAMWVVIGVVIAIGLGIMLAISAGKPDITRE